jgi:uncharacterized protein (TIGR03118 family)
MDYSVFFRERRSGPARPCWYRPVFECLEDRHVLSAGYSQVNLASDVPGLAPVTDLNLVNPWGMAYSPTGPFWLAENGRGISDILDGRGEPFALVVGVPSAARSSSTPAGIVFNGGTGFMIWENGVSAPARFVFVSEDGTISIWSAVVDPAQAIVAVDNSSSGAVYTGVALAADPTGDRALYVADFSRGTIDVFDQDFRPAMRPGAFHDPNLPGGFVPFNIQNIDDLLFVTYARQDKDKTDDVPGAGNGFIDEFDTSGNFIRRFASRGLLNDPWGLALAPANFGVFGGALLAGNNGDGHINAYDPHSGAFLGELADDNGTPIVIPDLWALSFGNGHIGGDSETLFFTAGVGDERHGLFGALQTPERRGADTAGAGAFDRNAPGEPGDYPLPPRNGPALRASRADLNGPVVDLLPLKESSLVLVPTLSTIVQSPPVTGATDPAGPIVVVASGGSAFTAVAALNSMVLLPGGNSEPPTLSLNTFLDVNASQNSSRQAGVPWPGVNLYAAATRGSPSADSDAGALGPLPDPYPKNVQSRAREEQGSPALPSSSQAGETGVRSEGRTPLPDKPGNRNKAVEIKNHTIWTQMMNGLMVLSIPLLTIILGCYARFPFETRSDDPLR